MGTYSNKDIVTPEDANQLKMLGFNLECDYFYLSVNGRQSKSLNKWYSFPEDWNMKSSRTSAPSYLQAFKWFIKERGLCSNIRINPLGTFSYEIWKSKKINDWRMIAFSNSLDYNELDKINEDCLKRLIELANKNDL